MRGVKERDLNALREFIVILDSYRVHRYVEIDSMDEAVKEGKLRRKLVAEWKDVRPILIKMANSAASIPDIMKLIRIRDTLSLVSMIFITASFALIIARIVLRYSPVAFGAWEELLYPSTIVLMFTALVSRVIINRKIGLKIESYHAENSEKFSTYQSRLKKLTQSLINVLSDSIKRFHEKPEDYTMKLYNCDYERIRVVEKPSRFRKYYVVIPECR